MSKKGISLKLDEVLIEKLDKRAKSLKAKSRTVLIEHFISCGVKGKLIDLPKNAIQAPKVVVKKAANVAMKKAAKKAAKKATSKVAPVAVPA